MNRTGYIFLAVLLLLTSVFAGKEVDLVHCIHSGKVEINICLNEAMHETRGCQSASDCMDVEHIELSPTDVSHSASYEFHAVPAETERLTSAPWDGLPHVASKCNPQFAYAAIKAPPRVYLNFINVLII